MEKAERDEAKRERKEERRAKREREWFGFREEARVEGKGKEREVKWEGEEKVDKRSKDYIRVSTSS